MRTDKVEKILKSKGYIRSAIERVMPSFDHIDVAVITGMSYTLYMTYELYTVREYDKAYFSIEDLKRDLPNIKK